MPETTLFAVVGDPVVHSRSPQIFNPLFRDAGLPAAYIRLSAASGKEAVEAAKSMSLAGLNVTSPFKSEVMPGLDWIDPQASTIDAVNCIVRRGRLLEGHNTDSFGACQALEANGVVLRNKRVAIFGAGGAARAAAYGMIKSGASKVILMNRTLEKAAAASRRLGCEHAPMEKAGEILRQSDILISCLSCSETPAGLKDLNQGLTVMDANYRDSGLARLARDKNCTVVDGLDWLFYQAIRSYQLFTGLEASPILQKQIKDGLSKAALPPKPNLALIGFMGSGKTAIGRRLAEKIGYEFVDTDNLLEESAGMTVADIFKKRGESFFRAQEKALIQMRLPDSRRTVFSLGGGAVLDEANRLSISRHCRTVWLWTSAPTALQRIDPVSRPLLDSEDRVDRAETILKSRLLLYAGISDLVFSTETGTPEDQARRIQHENDMD